MSVAIHNQAPAATPYRFDAGEVTRAVELLAPDIFELRAINCRVKGEYRAGTYSGYFQRAAVDPRFSGENAVFWLRRLRVWLRPRSRVKANPMTTASPDIVIAHVALLRAVDSLLATAAELREARAELGRLLENEKTPKVRQNGKRKATADATRSR